jgi:hypothetical protein
VPKVVGGSPPARIGRRDATWKEFTVKCELFFCVQIW